MKTALALAIAAAGTALLLGSAVFSMRAPAPLAVIQPAFAEANWPFPIDQWGTGKAFVCAAADCGAKVDIYIRPKIGFCNCATGVSDDAELERVSDTELLSAKIRARGPGRPIKVGWMPGLSRAYQSSDGATGGNLLSVAFNDDCDVVVAVANLGTGDPATLEPAILDFLNTQPVVLWAKKELGLEFVKRVW